MVLVDQRLVVVAAPVVFVFIEVIDLPERIAQRIYLRLAETVEIGALPRLAFTICIAPCIRVGGREFKFSHLAPQPIRGR